MIEEVYSYEDLTLKLKCLSYIVGTNEEQKDQTNFSISIVMLHANDNIIFFFLIFIFLPLSPAYALLDMPPLPYSN